MEKKEKKFVSFHFQNTAKGKSEIDVAPVDIVKTKILFKNAHKDRAHVEDPSSISLLSKRLMLYSVSKYISVLLGQHDPFFVAILMKSTNLLLNTKN